MEFVSCYQPLKVVQFWLAEGSPIHLAADAYGLSQIRNHSWYRAWFPADVLKQLRLMIREYRGDRNRQRKLWQPLRPQVASWKRRYQAARLNFTGAPLLGYNDGGSFLIVRRRAVDGSQAEIFRFEGKSREIFLYCDTVRSLEVVCSRFHPLSPKKIEDFIDDLVAKRLVFREGDRILGLALNEDIRGWTDAIDTS